MATQPPQEMPVSPEPVSPTQPAPEFEAPSPDIDIPDMNPSTEPGTIADDGLFASVPTIGHPGVGVADDLTGTTGMTASTGGMAGTSR